MAETHRKYVWDEDDEGESCDVVSPSKSNYVWQLSAGGDLSSAENGVIENFEALQARVANMSSELTDKREVVRRLRIELRRNREEAARKTRRMEYEWRHKLEESEERHGVKLEKQQALIAQLEQDVTQLERRVADLNRAEASGEDEQSIRAAAEAENARTLEKLQATWEARELKDFEAELEKKRSSIKAQIIKAFEPEIHRLIKSHKAALADKRAEAERSVDARRRELKGLNEARLVEAKTQIESEVQAQLARVREDLAKQGAKRREESEAELRGAWERHKDGLEEVRRRHEEERSALDVAHRRDIEQIENLHAAREREISEALCKDLASDAHSVELSEARVLASTIEPELAVFQRDAMEKLQNRRAGDLEQMLAPVRDKIQADLALVLRKLNEDAKHDRVEFERKLRAERRKLEDQNADALASLKTQEVAAMELYLRTAESETELIDAVRSCKEENSKVEAEIAAAGAELDAAAHLDQRCADNFEKAKIQIDRDHLARCAVVKGRILACHANFDDILAQIDRANAEHAATAAARNQHHAERLSQIHAKINAKLGKRIEKKDTLLLRLNNVRRSNAQLEAQVNARRLAHLANG